jgi:hypothetical protein
MADRSSEKKGLVGHPLDLAVVVGVQICMSVLVALGQVCRTGDRREPEQWTGNAIVKIWNLIERTYIS